MNIGSLFSGYGGLEQGVQSVLGGTVAWHSEIDPGACKILAHRYPDVPNLGDITAVDWSAVEPVDVLTGGSPCQDVSAAGKRLGMRAGTRSGLWASMCDAIDIIRPSLVVWENVRGVLSAGADSAVEPCPICVGDERESHLRALGRVVGDLAELGYVGRWTGLRAADVGAPHGRFRVFVVAWPAVPYGDARLAGTSAYPESHGRHEGRAKPARLIGRPDHALSRNAAQDADLAAGGERRLAAPGQAEGGRPRADAGGRGGAPAAVGRLLATPTAAVRTGGPPQDSRGKRDLRLDVRELVSVQVDEGVAAELDPRLLGDGVEVGRPVAGDQLQPNGVESVAHDGLDLLGGSGGLSGGDNGVSGHPHENPEPADPVNSRREIDTNWGSYTAAVRRWERLTRPAPAPVEPGKNGQPRLSPRFVEWMMGLPADWVTDVPGLSRNEQLKALGNGVVPQQAAHALRLLLSDVTAVAA